MTTTFDLYRAAEDALTTQITSQHDRTDETAALHLVMFASLRSPERKHVFLTDKLTIWMNLQQALDIRAELNTIIQKLEIEDPS